MLQSVAFPRRAGQAHGFVAVHEEITVRTSGCLQFLDLTDTLAEIVRRTGIRQGIVNVQSRHTTAAIVVNEAEPLLLDDLREALDRLAPRDARYRHDDFERRTVNLQPNEPVNGHAHVKALGLRTSESLNVVDGVLDLGRWQRLFLVELDDSRDRSVSVMVLGS